jgi:transcription elongation factor GreB
MRNGFTRRPKVETPAANHDKNYITPGGIERLKDERHFLLTKDRPAVVEVVAWAAGNGDRSLLAASRGRRRSRRVNECTGHTPRRNVEFAREAAASWQSGS